MCGRYTLTDPRRIESLFPKYRFREFSESRIPRFNIAPSQPVLGVRNDGRDAIEELRWGLHGRINVRGESLAARRDPLRRRCAIFADGFYEWRDRRPVYYTLRSGEPFAFAGVWEPRDAVSADCAIVTCTPNELVRVVHDRMPVILPAAALDLWLAPEGLDPEVVRALAIPWDARAMEARDVSRKLNNARYDAPDVLRGDDEQPTLF